MTAVLAVGAAFGLGLVLLVRGLAPPRRDLAAAVGRWDSNRGTAEFSATAGEAWSVAAGRWMASRLHRAGISLVDLRTDLRIVGTTLEAWLGRVLLSVLCALLVPTVVAVLARLLGLGVALEIPLSGGVILAAAAIGLEVNQLRAAAAARRRELLQALATYLDLFSMCLAGGRGVPEAMITSARIGQGWAFEVIRDTISQARRSGVTPWQALGDLGRDVGLQELVDLGASLGLIGDSGAKVRATLAARAGTLRRRQLAEAASEALKNDDSMRVSQLLMAVGFMVLIGYPAVVKVLAV